MQIFLKKEKWSFLINGFDAENFRTELESIKEFFADLRSVEGCYEKDILIKFLEYFIFMITVVDDKSDDIFKLILQKNDYKLCTIHTTVPFYDSNNNINYLCDFVIALNPECDLNLDKVYDFNQLDELINQRKIILLKQSEKNYIKDSSEFNELLEKQKFFKHIPLCDGALSEYHFDEYPELSTYILKTYSIEFLISLIMHLVSEKINEFIKEQYSKAVNLEDMSKKFLLEMNNQKKG